MSFKYKKVESKSDIKRFHNLPFRIYADYPNWRPALRGEVENIFDKNKNPFFNHGECERFLVYDDNRLVARFALMIDHRNDKLFNPQMGGIGFLEMEDNKYLAKAIIRFASEWHRSRGYYAMRGPINFGENENFWGLLVENYDDPPVYGMYYHPPYYKDLLEETGAEKFDDHFSYTRDLYDPFSDKMQRIAERLNSRETIQVRPLDMKNIYRDGEYIRQIYNQAWSNQEISEREDEFTEISTETVHAMIDNLKRIILPQSSFLTFVNGEPASFIITIPDMNELLGKTRGRIRLWHIPKLILFKKKVTRVRIIVYGTLPKYRRLGLEAQIFVNGIIGIRTRNKSLKRLEGAWVSEKNWLMQRSLEALGCVHHKTHRTYRWIFD